MKKIFILLLFFLLNFSYGQVSISIDKNSIKKDLILLKVKCDITTTIVFTQEGVEKSRKEFVGTKYFEITNKYEVIQVLDKPNENATYINLTNKKDLNNKPNFLKDMKEKELIYL